MLASSLIFSAAHFTVLDNFSSANILRSIWFTLNGVIYCELFRRRGNLYPAIFAHSAYNLLTSLFYIG
jgi:membrane protease YdiL (CAAX protease family)